MNREPCYQCGEDTPLGARICSHCYSSLLVDVALDNPVHDGRLAYRCARALAELEVVNEEFLDLKTKIKDAREPVVSGLTREESLAVLATLKELEISASTSPSSCPVNDGDEQQKVSSNRFLHWIQLHPVPSAVFAIAAVIVVVMMMVVRPGQLATENTETAESRPPFETIDQETDQEAQAALEKNDRSTRELAEIAALSSVRLQCGQAVGSGFFIAPDLVVTNAHVLGKEKTVTVTSSTGASWVGFAERSEPAIDIALVRVPNAKATPLQLGDASALRPGDRVMVIGTPEGLEFSVSEGIVSHTGRQVMGVIYLQIDANIHPGNSGGPVLEASGRVIGVVTMKVGDTSGLGLALPINYLYSGPQRLLMGLAPEYDEQAWNQSLEAASLEEWRTVQETAVAFDKPVLAGASLSSATSLTAAVIRLARSRPVPETFFFTLEDGDAFHCRIMGFAQKWEPLQGASLDHLDQRYVEWLRSHDLIRHVYGTQIRLSLNDCPDGMELQNSDLVLEGADTRSSRAKIGRRRR